MKKKEMREVVATYCDYCGAELTHINHSSVELKDGKVMDFCSTYTKDTVKTCLGKWKEDQQSKR